MQTKTVVILFGNPDQNDLDQLINCGADIVMVEKNSFYHQYDIEIFARRICHMIEEFNPDILLFGASCLENDLAARVGVRFNCDVMTDCVGLELESRLDRILLTCPDYTGEKY